VKIEINVYLHDRVSDSELLTRLDQIATQLTSLLEKIMQDISALQASVTAEDTVIASAVTLLQGVAAAITNAGVDPVALAALTTDITTQTAAPRGPRPRLQRLLPRRRLPLLRKDRDTSKKARFGGLFYLRSLPRVSASRASLPTLPGRFAAALTLAFGIFVPSFTPSARCRPPLFFVAPAIQFFTTMIDS
jgi:hypothetical protein